MSNTRITREEAVKVLRERIAEIADDDHSICDVASEHGIFCKGFAQWTFDELKRRYHWIVKRNPDISRRELEVLANAWQLGHGQAEQVSLACDVQQSEHDTCFGWDEFTSTQLSIYLHELAGLEVEVLPGAELE